MDGVNLNTVLVVSVAVVFVIVGLGRFMTGSMAKRWKQHRAATVDAWLAEGVEFTRGPTAIQFGGLESMGGQRVVRGAGLVMLTEKDLRVTCATPTTVWWTLNFKQIKGVTVQRAFLGKTANKTPFIVVRFKKDGQADKLGFQVKDVDGWATQLAESARVKLMRTDRED